MPSFPPQVKQILRRRQIRPHWMFVLDSLLSRAVRAALAVLDAGRRGWILPARRWGVCGPGGVANIKLVVSDPPFSLAVWGPKWAPRPPWVQSIQTSRGGEESGLTEVRGVE